MRFSARSRPNAQESLFRKTILRTLTRPSRTTLAARQLRAASVSAAILPEIWAYMRRTGDGIRPQPNPACYSLRKHCPTTSGNPEAHPTEDGWFCQSSSPPLAIRKTAVSQHSARSRRPSASLRPLSTHTSDLSQVVDTAQRHRLRIRRAGQLDRSFRSPLNRVTSGDTSFDACGSDHRNDRRHGDFASPLSDGY
jgi:hypothetical protein